MHSPRTMISDAVTLPIAQAGEGQAGGTLAKRPAGAGKGPAAGGPIARKAAAARRPTSGGRPSGGGGGAGILRFYTDDAPGLKM